MSERVIYSNPTTDGAGVGYKLERVPSPPAGGTCFANMNTVEDLQSCCDMNPEAAFHNLATRRIIAMGKVRGEQRRSGEEVGEVPNFDIKPAPRAINKVKLNVKAHNVFARGMSVKDRTNGRKGVIIHANAGYTKSSHTPVHRICDNKGNAWLAREDHLKRI